MRFPPDFLRFIAPGAERLVALAGMLAARDLPYTVLRTGEARHLALRFGSEVPRLILAAHYDRVEGSLGVLDNSCACLELVEFAARRRAGAAASPSFLVIFTDAEEAPGKLGAASQGSLGLARAIKTSYAGGRGAAAPRPGLPPPVLVFDVTGRGDRLLLSSASGSLMARRGRAGEEAAAGHADLQAWARLAAARAGLKPPLDLHLPWSDDLGLVLGGLGALTLSLLPEAEAALLGAGGKPPTWDLLHGPGDGLEAVEPASLALMAAFLDALPDCIE